MEHSSQRYLKKSLDKAPDTIDSFLFLLAHLQFLCSLF